jgi:hypothetical protein
LIDRDTVMALLQEVGVRHGFAADRDWYVTEVEELGWLCIPMGQRRTSFAVAVTPRGKVATFSRVTLSAADALRVLAAVPDDLAPPHPSQAGDWRPRPLDEAAALALVHRLFEGVADAPADWRGRPVEGQGWIFQAGPGAAVVVTDQGVVRIDHGQGPEKTLAAATVPDLSDIIEAARSADADSSPDGP